MGAQSSNNVILSHTLIHTPPSYTNKHNSSRSQKLLIHGSFTTRIPSTAIGTGTIHIPEWHDPYSPPSNYTGTGPFCTWPNYVLQSDEERGGHRVCDGRVGGNYSAPEGECFYFIL